MRSARIKDTLPFIDARDPQDKTLVASLAHRNSVPIVALLNNFTRPKNQEEGAGNWDTNAAHAVVSDAAARRNVAVRLRDWLLSNKLQGVNIDFEEVAAQDKDNLTLFMRELYATLHPAGLLVTQDIQLDSDAYDIGCAGKVERLDRSDVLRSARGQQRPRPGCRRGLDAAII